MTNHNRFDHQSILLRKRGNQTEKIMPSRRSRSHSSSSRSRSRSSSKRHKKKSHKRSKKRSRTRSPPPSPPSIRRDEGSNGSDSNSSYKPRLSSVMLPPSFLAKLESKEEEIVKTPPTEQSPNDSTTNNGQSTTTTTTATKRRKRRWNGDETDRVFLPNMPTMISATTMSEQEQKLYLLKVQVEELTRRLKVNDLGIPANVEERSPSPEPIYDLQGKRFNTREVRARRKIEDQRHQLVTEILTIAPDYKPPADYRPQQFKFSEKVLIPQEDYPEVNFVGLIIGPRGSTLKTLEKDTGAKIIIRGKGSFKDNKMGLVKHGPMPGDEEPLHAFITGPSSDSVKKAGEKVQEIINQSIDHPEGLNELRKQQLRQLALLNGTVRENDLLIKVTLVAEAEKIITNTIICTICCGAGHVSSDCKFRKNADGTFADPTVDASMLINRNTEENQKLDCEYQSLLNELTGKKDVNTNALSEAERRSLMTGSKISGPTLAIAGATPLATDVKPGVTTVGSLSFHTNGSIKSESNPPSLMSLHTNTANTSSNQSSHYSSSPSTSSNYSSTGFSNTGPRYNNSEVFDGYHLLRRHNRNNNYSSYIEGDSYRAQHIPALMENGGSGSNNTGNIGQTTSSSWSSSSYSRQNNYSNQQWNQWSQYNSSTYYQNAYQQPYYPTNSSTSTGFVPPLPKAPPPPPPPPL